MGPATTVLASSASSTITSVTPVNIFALIFEILVFILVVLSIVTLVRRYLGVRSQAQAQAHAQTTLTLDVEAQTTQGDSVKNISRFGRLLPLFSGRLFSRPRNDNLGDTDALLEKNCNETVLPSVPSGQRSPLSVFSRLRSLLRFGATRVKPESSLSDLERGTLYGSHAHADIRCALTEATDRASSCRSSIHDSETTDRTSISAQDHPIRERIVTAPTVGGPSCSQRCTTPQPPLATDIPTIIVTPPEEVETSLSPASTYSEPDSPTIATPPSDSSAFPDVRIAGDETNYLRICDPSLDATVDEEPVLNHYYGEVFEIGALSTTDKDPAVSEDDITPSQSICGPFIAQDSLLPRVLFSIGEEDEEQDQVEDEPTTSTVVEVTSRLDTMASHCSASSFTQCNVNHATDEEETPKVSRIVDACVQLDSAPILEFLQKGPALVAPHGDSINQSSVDAEEEDWEKAFRLGGRLTGAFSSPLSSDSLYDEDDDYDEEDGANEAETKYEVLHKTPAAQQVEVLIAYELIGHSFAAAVEWCDSTESSGSSSDHEDSDSDSESDYHDAGSDLESHSSFYSCSGSSFTEEDAGANDWFSDHKLNVTSELRAGAALPTALSVMEAYYVDNGYAA